MKRHNLKIRTATLDDLDDLVALLHELFSIEADFTPDSERQRRGLLLLLGGSPDRRVFVADANGRAVGMATVQVVISTAEGGPVGWVEDVIVAREHRGNGLGRRLLDAVERWATERGLARLQLLADQANTSALRFYEEAEWAATQLVCRRRNPIG